MPTEAAIQAAIVAALTADGVYVVRVARASRVGVADLLCCAAGRFVALWRAGQPLDATGSVRETPPRPLMRAVRPVQLHAAAGEQRTVHLTVVCLIRDVYPLMDAGRLQPPRREPYKADVRRSDSGLCRDLPEDAARRVAPRHARQLVDDARLHLRYMRQGKHHQGNQQRAHRANPQPTQRSAR